MEILLGCGHDRGKKLHPPGRDQWSGLVTVDMNPEVRPDVVADVSGPLPFAADSADEIHAYDVLEHLGAQGDWRLFFAQFSEWWRILKPGGFFCALVPRHDREWAWGDPGHTRVIQPESLTFLSQQVYADELDGEHRTNRTDYRRWYRADFDLFGAKLLDAQLAFVLRAVKPSRWKAPA